jgi:hypothetical protein
MHLIQSPLSFGGFGALTRHLGRISSAVAEAVEHDLLHKNELGLINAYSPNLGLQSQEKLSFDFHTIFFLTLVFLQNRRINLTIL